MKEIWMAIGLGFGGLASSRGLPARNIQISGGLVWLKGMVVKDNSIKLAAQSRPGWPLGSSSIFNANRFPSV
jgi:hypothetical protein